MSTDDVTGRLLIASPDLRDGIFDRTVVLVLHHDDDGAQGVVLNQPFEAALDDVLVRGWSDFATAPAQLFQGGPVSTDTALGLVLLPESVPAGPALRRIFASTAVVDLDAEPVQALEHARGLRVFVGYSGWSAGQLEGEIAVGGWFVVDADPLDAFSTDPQNLWAAALRRQSGQLSWLATYPADPTLN